MPSAVDIQHQRVPPFRLVEARHAVNPLHAAQDRVAALRWIVRQEIGDAIQDGVGAQAGGAGEGSCLYPQLALALRANVHSKAFDGHHHAPSSLKTGNQYFMKWIRSGDFA